MANIRLARTDEYINRFREYGIYIDGTKAGVIRNGETKDFEVTPGTHTIYAKIDWCYSPSRSFTISDREPVNFSTGSSLGFGPLARSSKWIGYVFAGILLLHVVLSATIHFNDLLYYLFPLTLPLFLVMVYYFSIGRKKYLRLIETPEHIAVAT